jgi:CcmD family protein
MKNFESLFIAWMIVWAVFFGYQVTIARRLSQVRDEIERLKSQMGRK